jgi:hypothetical protein
VQLASEFLKFCLCDNCWHNGFRDDDLFSVERGVIKSEMGGINEDGMYDR